MGSEMFRKTLFWAHLVSGLIAGLFILTMSVTGVLLTFESQIEDWTVARTIVAPDGAVPLTADRMVTRVLEAGAQAGQTLTLDRDPTAPAGLASGRDNTPLNPYTGAPISGAGETVQAFFEQVTRFHRWLSVSGSTEVGGTLIDASNLLFLFLIVSGLYLWIPPIFRWSRLKLQIFFRRGLPNPQARHYNWHHVFAIWALIPLFFISLSGVVMSYSWANGLVFAAVGEEAPAGRGRPGGNDNALSDEMLAAVIDGAVLSYAALIAQAAVEAPDWNTASIVLPAVDAAYLQLTLDEGNGVQSARRIEFALGRVTGEILSAESGAGGTLGARLRGWFRFVHTGQIYGIVGQTIAGLASLASLILVYTGISLGLRRLRRLWRRSRAVGI